MIRKSTAGLVIFLVAAWPLQAQVYQWVDEDGVKHFSNSPPPEGITDVHEIEELKSGAAARQPGEGGQQSSAGVEEAATADEAGELGAIDEPAETSDTEEEEGPESRTAGRTEESELVERERQRLEITLEQLNRRLEEAQTARDRGSSYDVEQWNERIDRIRAEIENEKSRSAARIEQIRGESGSQP